MAESKQALKRKPERGLCELLQDLHGALAFFRAAQAKQRRLPYHEPAGG